MASLEDLEEAVTANLHSRGVIDELKARIRRETLASLSAGQMKITAQPPKEVLILNELIREYLDATGYKQTSAVLGIEAAIPKEQRLNREVIEAYLKIIPPPLAEEARTPLLYSIVFGGDKQPT